MGRIEAAYFAPERWKPEYPNSAFDNMRPDDAFWAARLLTAFDDDLIRAAVKSAQFSDPEADAYLAQTLITRKDKILQAWLNGVLPLDDFVLSRDGTLTFTNVAAAAVAAQSAREYRIRWFAFDNQAGTTTPVGDEVSVTEHAGRGASRAARRAAGVRDDRVARHPRSAPGVGVPAEGVLPPRASRPGSSWVSSGSREQLVDSCRVLSNCRRDTLRGCPPGLKFRLHKEKTPLHSEQKTAPQRALAAPQQRCVDALRRAGTSVRGQK